MIDTDRLRKVFRASLGLPDDAEVDALEYQAIDKWDSLAHMTLVAAVEDEFGVMLDTDDVLAMSSFTKARELLAEPASREQPETLETLETLETREDLGAR